ncbi:kinetochore complex Fta4 of Sim4 subunit, or CENP-50-domain-containing protein [Rhypophila decipiens]|uniref:Kinetochore complex Fta4 of Sim4 subunit, or CENP-50-domain-containing protein n=1 Tax=Rhypophila decipiens TaxID=261697 RepID=A0AAN6YJ69_9PEZI|nr:kinetochore complex Fta4 of Sim4 subunit, or CENP-50-domain-containing protein [Rhypophila decipiens]
MPKPPPTAAPPPPTVVSIKQDWLATQTRLLSQDLEPSRAWRAANDDEKGNTNDNGAPIGLPDKAVDDAIWALNHRLQQHAKRVYSRQATRHIAEQIDQLYWDASNRAAGTGLEDEDEDGDDEFRGLSWGADLVDPKIISNLPPTWDHDAASQRQSQSYPTEAATYSDLVSQLKSLSSQKQALSSRVSRLKRIKNLLESFDTTTPSTPSGEEEEEEEEKPKLQDNLITRDGQIEKELQKMRMLLARVGGRVDQLQEQQKPKGKRKRTATTGNGEEPSEAAQDDEMDLDAPSAAFDGQRKLDVLFQKAFS